MDTPEEPNRDLPRATQRFSNLSKYSTLGLQYTLGVFLFGWAGHWLDQQFGWRPWGAVTGILLGFVGSTAWLYQKIYGKAEAGTSGPERVDGKPRDGGG